jgi:sugar/nucleoside kinase (ribokinase family)
LKLNSNTWGIGIVRYDILTLGDYFFDQIFSGLPRFPVLGCETYADELVSTGGAMYISVAVLTSLGAKVGWPAYFGDDYYSCFVRGLARQNGIDLELAKIVERPYQRVSTSIPYQGDRAFVTFVDPEADDLQQHWLESMDRCEFSHLHLGGWTPVAQLRLLAEKAHRKGATVSMDCQDVQCLLNPSTCLDPLEFVDIFMPNAREAKIVTESNDIESALEKLMSLVKLAVVKDGENGAWIGHKGTIIHSPAIFSGRVVDTTGAGDCFNAGFLFGHLVENLSLDTCLRYGNFCGGFSVASVGGATKTPTYDELKSRLKQE